MSDWGVYKEGCEFHVIPIDDTRPHLCSRGCWCVPVAEGELNNTIVHNSLDGRELVERGEMKLQ